jgi:hypothetical protein
MTIEIISGYENAHAESTGGGRHWTKRALNLFFSEYAGMGCIVALAYIIPEHAVTQRSKLLFFFAGFSAISILSTAVFILWLAARRRDMQRKAASLLDPSQSISESLDERFVSEDDATVPLQVVPPQTHPVTCKMARAVCRALGAYRPIFMSFDFWLTWLVLAVTFGLSVNFMNNAGSIMLSRGMGGDAPAILYLTFSGGQLVGRFLSKDFTTDAKGNNVVKRLLIVMAISLCAQLGVGLVSLFTSAGDAIYAAAAVNAVTYGANWVLVFGLVSPNLLPLDGAQAAGTVDYLVISALNLAPVCGPLAVDYCSGVLYDRFANSSTHECTGTKCYEAYFAFQSVTAAAALPVLGLLALRLSWRGRLV